jgi:hypothetical protein
MRVLSLLFAGQRRKRFCRNVVITVLICNLLNPLSWGKAAQAQITPYCQLSAETIAQTSALHTAALQGNQAAAQNYQAVIAQQADQLRRCRSQTWPQQQAIWLRLYPCDVREGMLDEIFDRIVAWGYNEVFVEAFSDGQVLLPSANNPTVWPAVIRTPGYENTDLLADAIAKGRARGLKMYAWMFALNFGYTYSQRPEAEQVLARNGQGDTSLTFRPPDADVTQVSSNEAFVDPYNLQAKQEYQTLIQAVLQRQPDGVLFDYIRYPKGIGSASVVDQVKDLWIYGSAAQQALYDRALNQKGKALIQRFLNKGQITSADVSDINAEYPQEGEPLWQGRSPGDRASLGTELWHLSLAHAIQGILDFLATAVLPVQQRGIPAGAVFFPDGNQMVRGGYDSRLQPWDKFPGTIEWHPMSYAICSDGSCIVSQIRQVMDKAPAGTQIEPALAGAWGQSINGHPPLEVQMQAIRQALPQLNAVSHFAFSWQDPQLERDRKFCRL